ncbi:MAG: GNAT family N-acetyltransferase, partial [Bacteroidota bacterium]
MIDFKTHIESELVLLRPTKLDDFEEMLQLTQDPQMWYYFTSDLSDQETLRGWLKRAVDELHNRSSLPFTIVDLKSKNIIGCTRIGNISEEHQRLEIGWTWIAKDYQGTGINGHVKQL